jgi:hypothetical protein
MHGRRRHGKRGFHEPRGHLTTRRQMPIGRGMCPHQISCSNSSACTPFLLLTYRSTIAELRSRSWREGGSAQRSLALVSARCKGRRLRCRVFCNLYCRCTYSALRDSSIAAHEVSPCPDIVSSAVKYFVQCLLSCKIYGAHTHTPYILQKARALSEYGACVLMYIRCARFL